MSQSEYEKLLKEAAQTLHDIGISPDALAAILHGLARYLDELDKGRDAA